MDSNNLPAQPNNYQPYQSDRSRIMGYQRDRYSPAPPAHRYDPTNQPRGFPDPANPARGYPEPANQQRGFPAEPANQQRGYPDPASQQRGYNEPANQMRVYPEQGQQPRGYPVGRETNAPGSYQQAHPAAASSYNNRPYQDSYKNPNPPGQYGPASANNAMSASYPAPNQSNISNDVLRRSQTSAYPTSGYNQPHHDGQGSYNAGAMNRQLNQQMNNYYDSNRPSNGQERQPPIGQNNVEGRAPANAPPGGYNTRYNGPQSSYKQLDYGPQGMINPSTGVQHYPRYGGNSNLNGAPRPGVADPRGYNSNQPPYNMRQPTYQ